MRESHVAVADLRLAVGPSLLLTNLQADVMVYWSLALPTHFSLTTIATLPQAGVVANLK